MPPPKSNSTAPALTVDRREVTRIISLLKKPSMSLADYHAIGEQMQRLSADATVTARGSKWRDKVAELVATSVSTLTKAFQFRLAYQEEDLPELEGLGLGWSRLTIALAIDNRAKRHRLLREAREKGWGERELQRAIQQLKGSKRGGGRPRKEMQSQGTLADAAELVRLTELWLEFNEKVWASARASDLKELDEAASANLARLLRRAGESLKMLKSQSKDAKAQVDSLLEELPD